MHLHKGTAFAVPLVLYFVHVHDLLSFCLKINRIEFTKKTGVICECCGYFFIENGKMERKKEG